MTNLILYTRPGCHLCEEARTVCLECGLDPEPLDISGNLRLLEAYGNRIPVLRRTDTGAELGWPFDTQAVKALLKRR